MEELESPDRTQCQADRPNKTWSAFNLGPAHVDAKTGEKRGGSRMNDRLWRCREVPVCIVEEREGDEFGIKGQMSLCGDCFIQLFFQDPNKAILKEDLR